MQEIQEFHEAQQQMTSKEAWQLEQEIKKYRLVMNISFWKMIEKLDYAYSVKIWEKLGYDTWGSWLAQESISLHADTINRYLRGYKALKRRITPDVMEDVCELPRSKVLLIANKVTPENAEEMVTRAKELSYTDLRVSLNPDEEETPERSPKPRFSWCHYHGKWRVVYGDLDNVCDC